jgi:ABC-2 type transport system ATP-binding protein
MIEMKQLTKQFDTKTAVDALDLNIPTGQLFAFLGPNGAGKTTSIKMMTGLLRPTSGSVAVCGHDLLVDPIPAKAALSYIPDQPYLYEKLSGREFMEFVGRMYEIPKGEMDDRIHALGERLELLRFFDDLSERYSHGMKQRVVIAAALLHDPSVLVIDEPMVGLDPKTSRTVKDILRERADAGTTVFMSTHTLHVAEELADRIGIIDEGKLIAVGTLSELHEKVGGAKGLEELFLELTAHEEAPWQPE